MPCNCRDRQPSRRRREQKVRPPSEQHPAGRPAGYPDGHLDQDHSELRWTGQEGALWANDWLADQRGPYLVTMTTKRRHQAMPHYSAYQEQMILDDIEAVQAQQDRYERLWQQGRVDEHFYDEAMDYLTDELDVLMDELRQVRC